MLDNTKIGKSQIGKPAPLWFRKFKKILTNTETAVIVILLAMGYANESLLMLLIKTGSSWLIENLETILGDGQYYVPSDQTIENQSKS